MITEEEAKAALIELLWELPYEFGTPPQADPEQTRSSFWVYKRRNVRKVHKALWTLQQYHKVNVGSLPFPWS